MSAQGEKPAEFMTPDEVCHDLRISGITLNRWIKAGRYPKPVWLSDVTRRFRRDLHSKFKADRMKARRTKPAPRGFMREGDELELS